MGDQSIIKHTVFFTLKEPQQADDFLSAARKLALIHGVQKFECLRQISVKNNFEYGLSMEFAGQDAYDGYSNHPDHAAFIQHYWLKFVDDFMEIDYRVIMS